MAAVKRGPLTREELMDLWQSVTDAEYHKPLLEKDNSNIEAIEQAAEQFARVSQAIDRNTQRMYYRPWSGQTAPPAEGAAHARTQLTVTRSARFELPLVITQGEVFVQHVVDDFGPDGPQPVFTGRRYIVEQTAVLGPGSPGPVLVDVVAEHPGPAYNEPTPGTLNTIAQPGVGFVNSGATVQNQTGSTNRVLTTTFPDVPITEHVGQYLEFTSGANAGQTRRIIGVENPDPSVPHGGVFALSAEAIIVVENVAGSFSYGERIDQPNSGAVGLFIALHGTRMVVQRRSGTFAADPIVGEFGATADVTVIEQTADLVSETGTAAWRIVSWHLDLAVEVTNETQPTGGRSPWLDELGDERGLPRLSGEGDDEYRARIAKPADVVSPGAVVRAGNSVVEPYDETVCLREVGRPEFPGVFYDGAPSQLAFAYDLDLVELALLSGNAQGAAFPFFDSGPAGFYDDPAPQTTPNFYSTGTHQPGIGLVSSFIAGERVYAVGVGGVVTSGVAHFEYPQAEANYRVFKGVVRVRGPGFQPGDLLIGAVSGHRQVITGVSGGLQPEHRWFVALNLHEYRGFFLVGVPRLALEDFGLFYDTGGVAAYDATNVDNFYDGAALEANSVYARVWNKVNGVRMAGVPFDLYLEDFGC